MRSSDFAGDDVDVAVRAGRGPWPGLATDLLIQIDFTPMCSPDFLARHGGHLAPADLLGLPLISPHDPWWAYWLHEAGVAVPDGPLRPGVRMDSQANEGNAAIAGQGVAMLTPFFWRNDLADGRLVRLFDQVSTRGYAYWLVIARASPRRAQDQALPRMAAGGDPARSRRRQGRRRGG